MLSLSVSAPRSGTVVAVVIAGGYPKGKEKADYDYDNDSEKTISGPSFPGLTRESSANCDTASYAGMTFGRAFDVPTAH